MAEKRTVEKKTAANLLRNLGRAKKPVEPKLSMSDVFTPDVVKQITGLMDGPEKWSFRQVSKWVHAQGIKVSDPVLKRHLGIEAPPAKPKLVASAQPANFADKLAGSGKG